MTLNLTPGQFAFLKAQLSTAPGVVLVMDTPYCGTMQNSDVTLAFGYDECDKLEVDVTARHSFKAKIAPQSTIDARIAKMFNEFLKNGESV